MGESTRDKITGLRKTNKRHARYVGMLACLAMVVALGVAAVLRQSGRAATYEQTVLDCHYAGNGAHTHTADCFDANGNLVCPLPQRELHVHNDSCYSVEQHLVCGQEESAGHTHSDACYDEEGNLICGQEESAGHVHTDACYETTSTLICGKEEITEEHVHGPGCFTTVTVTVADEEPVADETDVVVEELEADEDVEAEDEAEAEDEETDEEYPAQEFKESLKRRDNDGVERVVLTVAVKAPKGALPAESEMHVSGIASKDIASVEAKVDEAIKRVNGEKAQVKQYQAVDITFFDKDGNEIEPKKNVEVKITSDKVGEIENPVLVHVVDKTKDNQQKNVDAEVVSISQEGQGEDTLKFKSNEFSPYVIVELEELKAEFLSASGATYEAKVVYANGEGFPMGLSLQISEIREASRAYVSAFEAVAEQKKAEDESFDEKNMGMAAFDISIVDENGNVWEPESDVIMSLKVKSLPEEAVEAGMQETMELQHLNTSTGEVVVETLATATDGSMTVDETTAQADVKLGSFSVFALTWDNNQATIHYGYQDTSSHQFVEFEEEKVALLDTTAATVSLENNFDGYSFIGATYKASASADAVDIKPAQLTKESDGWQITTVTHNADDTTTTETVTVANGSDIYVYYGTPQEHQSSTGNPDVKGPTTTKSVKSNEDGTYDITLDVTAPYITETDQVGANVLIVFDRTRSMNGSMTGATSRLAAAKSAVATLVNILSTGENAGNDIDYSLVSFYRVADSIHTWGTDAISGRTTWTKNATTFNNYVQGLSVPSSNQTGTNWESGLYQTRQALGSKDNDHTYVIFLTDGEPNRRGTTSYQQADTATAISYALTQAQAITGTANVSLYGVFCGSDSGYNNLANMIRNAGGVSTINGTNSAALEAAFSDIAHTIVSNLGSSGVNVDDGVTELSSVSAQIADGTTGGYRYYKATVANPQDSDFQTWADAPGASFSDDNGVTWDLSSVGTLAKDTTYRVVFTVWPSQAAYDLVADLNNGLKSYSDLSADEKAQVQVNEDDTYSLLTNTHLNTTYTYKGETYTDQFDKGDNAMKLDVEAIRVKKLWENSLDSRGADEVELHVNKDGADYLAGDNAVKVSAADDWTSKEIFISCGFIRHMDGSYKVLETGHDYTITEPEEYAYYWDLTSDIFHPMVVDGVAKMLVKTAAPTGAEGTDYFVINGASYQVMDGENVFTATNSRRSYLNVYKNVIGIEATTDAAFEYTASIGAAGDDDIWFSVDSNPAPGVEGFTPVAAADFTRSDNVKYQGDGTNGYFYVKAGEQFTFEIKAGWNVRFINLPLGTGYSIAESDDGGEYGFTFSGVASAANNGGTAAATDSQNKSASGTIDKSNVDYSVTFTNAWVTKEIGILKVAEGTTTPLAGATFSLTQLDGAGNEVAISPDAGFDPEALRDNGQISGVKLGNAIYVLTETGAPDGYNVLANKVYFKLDTVANTMTLVDKDGKAATYDNASVDNDTLTITISNTPGKALPNTGGYGTTMFYVLGTALAVIGILAYGLLSRVELALENETTR